MISCDCSTDDGETADSSWTKFPKARKEHVCVECGGVIKKGEKYELVSGVWDGQFQAFKTCLPCVAIRRNYCSGGWIYGEVRDQIWDCLGFDYTTVPEEDDD